MTADRRKLAPLRTRTFEFRRTAMVFDPRVWWEVELTPAEATYFRATHCMRRCGSRWYFIAHVVSFTGTPCSLGRRPRCVHEYPAHCDPITDRPCSDVCIKCGHDKQ